MRPGNFLLVFVLVTTPALAQRPAVGVALSITRSTFTGGEAADAGDAGTGFSVGASLRRAISSRVWIEPELRVSRQHAGARGYQVNCPQSDPDGCGWTKVSMTTVDLPVLFRASLARAGAIRSFVTLGPSVSYRLGCTRRIDNFEQGELESGCDLEFSDPLADPAPGGPLPALLSSTFRRWDLSLVAGIGAQFHDVLAEVRIERGLQQVEQSAPFPLTQLDRSRLLHFSFSVGVLLP